MSLPEYSVRNPVTTFMVVIAVVLLGGISFTRLPVDLLPEIDFPSVSIVASYEGVGPEEIETLITRPIEASMATVQGIDRIDSTSAEGFSRVSLRFAWGTNLDEALNDVRANLERLRERLPEDMTTPSIYKFNLGSFPIVFLSLGASEAARTGGAGKAGVPAASSEEERLRLRLLAETHIKPRIERVDGVALVDIRGGLRREIHVELDLAKMDALALSPDTVVAAILAENRNLPAGDVLEAGREVIVRTLAEFTSVKEIEDVVITVRDGTPIHVAEVAKVGDRFEEPTNSVRVNGEPGVRLAVSKKSGANTVEVAARIAIEVERLNRDYPDIAMGTIVDSSRFIKSSITNVQQGVLYGSLLSIVVLFFFLRGIGATLIISTAIPVSIIAAFGMMYLAGFTMNMITFAGLALGGGMLVDTAIVILENVVRKRDEGMAPAEAAIAGSREVGMAVVSNAVTTCIVFVPVMFVGGFAGVFFKQMAWVVTFSQFCSLLVALTLVPMLASKLVGRKSAKGSSAGRGRTWIAPIENFYQRRLRWMLAHRKTTVIAALLLLAGSVALAPRVGFELIPASDEGGVDIDLKMPVGTPLHRTDDALRRLEDIALPIVGDDLVIRAATSGRPGFWSTSGASVGTLSLLMRPLGPRTRSSEEVVAEMRKAIGSIAGYDVRVRAGGGFFLTRMLSGGGERLQVEVVGHDLPTAGRLAAEVKKVLEGVEGVTDVRVDREEGNRESVIRIDRGKAAALGLTATEVGNALETYLLGKTATMYRDGGDEFKVLVRLAGADHLKVDEVLDLPVFRRAGAPIALRTVVSAHPRVGPVSINRLNQNRIITVSAGFNPREVSLGVLADRVNVALGTGLVTPEAFNVRLGGELEEQSKTFRDLLLGLLLAVILMYMVMAAQFESLLHPFVVMFSIPFAAIGVIGALLITGTTFNIYGFIGVIVLLGVVVSNAIVLVDYVNLLRREHGMELIEAVVETGRRRLRPIFMTTATTLLGLLPVAIGFGEGAEQQTPLARVVLGGLLTSTVITLGVIPVMYVAFERLRERFGLRFGKAPDAPAGPEAAPAPTAAMSPGGAGAAAIAAVSGGGGGEPPMPAPEDDRP